VSVGWVSDVRTSADVSRVRPAPSDIKKTSAERLSTQIMSENLPKASTREQKERQDQRRELERRIRTQDHWEPFAQQQMDTGLSLSRTSSTRSIERLGYLWTIGPENEAGGCGEGLEAGDPGREAQAKADLRAESRERRRSVGLLTEKQRKKLATQILEILNEQVPNPPPGE